MSTVVDQYYKQSKGLVYSYLLSLPLLFAYEFLIYFTQADPRHYVRVGADVWIKSMLAPLGYNTVILTFVLALIIGLVILWVERKKEVHIRLSFLFGVVVESFFYALILGFILTRFTSSLVHMADVNQIPLSPIQRLALSLGAGLYEELFFRVILVTVLLWLMKLFTKNKRTQYIVAVVVAALLFSLAHYTGSLGEPFTIYSFIFRFLFGLALTVLYVVRGFGAAAWTHAIYDTMVLLFLS